MTADAYFCNIPIEEYLSDISRTTGSVLSMVERSPEEYGMHLSGKLKRRSSPAMNQGEFFHARILEPDEVTRRFSFAPARAEDGPGRWKAIDRRTKAGKETWQRFIDSSVGLTVITPEQQRIVEAMVRAVYNHDDAAALLLADGDMEAEPTGHWTCCVTGEQMAIRPDWTRRSSRYWGELKSIAVKGMEDRLDTSNPSNVGKWARAGWARKDAMLHDGCSAITDDEWHGFWIVVEALPVEALNEGHEPRVSVIHDRAEVDEVPCLYTIGKNGWRDSEDRPVVRGYLELVEQARALRASGRYRHHCTMGVAPQWQLPAAWLRPEDSKPVALTGARKVKEASHG